MTALAMATLFTAAAPLHFVSPALAWCEVGTEGCGETGDEGGGDEGGGTGGTSTDGGGSTGGGTTGGATSGSGGVDAGASSPELADAKAGVGKGGDGGDLAPLMQTEQIAKMEETCNGALERLAKVSESTVAAFSNRWAVTVIAVCNNGLGHQASIDDSQVAPLRSAIASNPALAEPLDDNKFTVEDVVGVIVSGDSATLYVHKGSV
jgi:hypothetical protein